MVNAATIPDKRALNQQINQLFAYQPPIPKKKKPFKILAPLVQYILYFLPLGARDFIH
jgi:hypothetical protein